MCKLCTSREGRRWKWRCTVAGNSRMRGCRSREHEVEVIASRNLRSNQRKALLWRMPECVGRNEHLAMPTRYMVSKYFRNIEFQFKDKAISGENIQAVWISARLREVINIKIVVILVLSLQLKGDFLKYAHGKNNVYYRSWQLALMMFGILLRKWWRNQLHYGGLVRIQNLCVLIPFTLSSPLPRIYISQCVKEQ